MVRIYPKVTDKLKSEVLNYFYTQSENGLTTIAKYFGLRSEQISAIINADLKKKRNYYVEFQNRI